MLVPYAEPLAIGAACQYELTIPDYAKGTIDSFFENPYFGGIVVQVTEAAMRREMLEALSFPRTLILRLIDERDCPHKNLFEATSERCSQCDIGRECHWVSCLNEFSDFEDKPTHTINASLRYGVKLVESHFDEHLHRDAACDCEHCDWVRHAHRLIEQFEVSLPENPYRPPH